MIIQMKVEGLVFDTRSEMYILLLRAVDGNETLPIWIGKPEADSIALTLGKVMTPRPLTHDLIKNMLQELNMTVSKVVVRALIDNTYYATLYVADGKSEMPVDARPSDAVAVALRTNSPIYVDKEVIETQNRDELEEWLKNLKPDDFDNIM